MDRALRDAIGRLLGTGIVAVARVSGGDINEAHALDLADGSRVFAKTNARADPRMFPAEARGLAWLGEGPASTSRAEGPASTSRAEGPLRVPRVLAVDPRFLLLEWIEPGRPAREASEALGRGLARLHALGAPGFGLDHDNFLATIAQDNTPAPDWPSFYGARRLEPLLRQAAERGLATARMTRGIDRVLARLPELCGPPEPPARLHGDLWAGNRIHDEAGAPVLVDPAAYGGHREIDLAMMRLFGGFDARAFAAYEEERPLAAGHAERVPLYQLLPLLAHVVLFGGGYVGSVEAALERLI